MFQISKSSTDSTSLVISLSWFRLSYSSAPTLWNRIMINKLVSIVLMHLYVLILVPPIQKVTRFCCNESSFSRSVGSQWACRKFISVHLQRRSPAAQRTPSEMGKHGSLICTAKDQHLVFWPDCLALPWDVSVADGSSLIPLSHRNTTHALLSDCTTNTMCLNKLQLLTRGLTSLWINWETDCCHRESQTVTGASIKMATRYLFPVSLFRFLSSLTPWNAVALWPRNWLLSSQMTSLPVECCLPTAILHL